MTNFEFQYELQDVRRSATALMRRIEQLEMIAETMTKAVASAATVGCLEEAILVQPESLPQPQPLPSTQPEFAAPSMSLNLGQAVLTESPQTPAVVSAIDEPKPTESMEVWLGKNLNKIGISFLVIGLGLALVYQFQYFTPLFKILTGILAGVALILSGEWFERKPTFNWYGRALIGGGWSLAYFSAFAAHHVQSVRIIDSALADLILLAGIAFGAVKYSLRYKSQAVTGLTMTLGFIAICMSPDTTATAAAIAILIAGTAYLVWKMRWFTLLVYTEVVSYVLGLAILLPQILSEQTRLFGMSLDDTHFFVSTAYSVFCWAVFNLIIFSIKYTNKTERNRVATASFINALFFVPIVFGLMCSYHSDWRSSFLYSTALAYALTGFSAKQNSMYAILKLHTVMALSLATYAVSFNLHGNTLTTFWCLEVPVLVWAGYYFDMAVVRRFAAFLALVCANSVMSNVSLHFDRETLTYVRDSKTLITDLTALAAACASSAVYVYQSIKTSRETHQPPKGSLAFYFYSALAALASMSTTLAFVPAQSVALVLTLQCLAAIAIGAIIMFPPLRVVGTIGIICSQTWFLAFFPEWLTLPTVIIVGLHYVMSYFYRTTPKANFDPFENGINNAYAIAGTTILAILLGRVVAPEWLTVAWTLQGIALLFVGFQIKDKLYRVSGLVMMSIVIGRLLLFELAGLETIYRIISFMAAGVVLLVASFAYAKLGSKDSNDADTVTEEKEISINVPSGSTDGTAANAI